MSRTRMLNILGAIIVVAIFGITFFLFNGRLDLARNSSPAPGSADVQEALEDVQTQEELYQQQIDNANQVLSEQEFDDDDCEDEDNEDEEEEEEYEEDDDDEEEECELVE